MKVEIPKSRKLWVTILTVAIAVANSVFGWGIDVNVILSMFGVAGTYNLGQGLADGLSDGKTSSAPNGKAPAQ